MLLLSSVAISAPILAWVQACVPHIEAGGVSPSGRLTRAGFLGGSSSRLWARRFSQPVCTTGRGRAGDRSHSFSTIRAIGDPGQSTFLSLEEAGLVDMTNLDMHEKFLARLTVSSLNLLRAISEQEGVPIEELNAGKICDWFVHDKEKREKNINEATLKWDTGEW